MRKYSTLASVPGHISKLPAQPLIRCLLAIAVLASTLITFIPGPRPNPALQLSYEYSIYSIFLYIRTVRRADWSTGLTVLSIDGVWCALMLLLGGASGFAYMIVVFTVRATAPRYGFADDQRMTIVCSAMVFSVNTAAEAMRAHSNSSADRHDSALAK